MSLIDIIAALLKEHKSTSDIHIKSGHKMRCRIHGDIKKIDYEVSEESLCELMYQADKRIEGKDLHQLLDEIEVNSNNKKSGYDFSCYLNEIRFRGNLSHTNGRNLWLVLRQLNSVIPSLSDLGLPDVFTKLISANNGLCLITGATGSGKSTTLASALQYISDNYEKNILTIEDPVEYLLQENKSMISQKEVGFDVASFEGALRSGLRQDPDIVMIGEIRDLTTMKAAIDMAETGHLVFGTLHTNGAISTIERCMSFFDSGEKDLARNSLGSTLNFVLSQTLVKKKDGTGRLMAYDLMIKTTGIRQSIIDNKVNHIANSMETGSQDNQFLMHKVLKNYYDRGLITKDAALEATNNLEKLKEVLK